MKGTELLASIERKLRKESANQKITNGALADKLGVSSVNLWQWRQTRRLSTRQVANMVAKARESAARSAERQAIRPIVEFFEVKPVESRGGDFWELFATGRGQSAHPYLSGLRKELERSHGVYIFYDSRGRVLYVGKARRQNLWAEMRSALNRDRGDLQQIKRVAHPSRKKEFKASYEKRRQIRHHRVPLWEMITYVSVYRVSDGLIGELESLLVRGFANDILNKRMEQFGGSATEQGG